MKSTDVKKIIKISKALADENRYKIFETIADNDEIVCKKLTEMFPLSQPTISHRLKLLTESELVNVRREGQWGYFSINQKTLKMFIKGLTEFSK